MGDRGCALLDTDFISKLYDTKINESDMLIKRIVSIEKFHFVCHYQTVVELKSYHVSVSDWVENNGKITVYTDRTLLRLLLGYFGSAAYGLYLNMLKVSCDTFSYGYFEKYYASLIHYHKSTWLDCNMTDFIKQLQKCDEGVGKDNNLGEIKLYTTAQLLEATGIENLYIFCSDDRKARSVLVNQENIDCVSAIASFYLAKKYLSMDKDTARLFFDSWMELHKNYNQAYFRVYRADDFQMERVLGQDLFDMLYEDKLYLQKDGLFKMK